MNDFSQIDFLQKEIVGKWIKINDLEGSEIYPDEIDFQENGIYFGKEGVGTELFTLWDVGTYQIVSENMIKISTANDEIIAYRFWIEEKILRF
ncbi:MAG: hypothetical protein NWF10_05225 [Candidatus Bathyarchaeota archaeon]|nr:hypothetical protein [Candidatus Bathyarchaeota archaeon]